MPVIRSMMESMMRKYGPKKGKSIYYGTETNMKKKGKLRSMIATARKHNDLV